MPRQLRLLAVRAKSRRGWARLRQYARTARNAQDRSLAYFTLGYREYQAREWDLARADLRLAAQMKFPVTGLAAYYEALADQQLGRDGEGIHILQGFARRYPQSAVRLQAVTLLANLLIQSQRAKEAIQVLTGTPGARKEPACLLALAKAYEAVENPLQAATVYDEIYYGFPVGPPAFAAGLALSRLRVSMGALYSQVPEKREAARARVIFDAFQYDKALSAYSALLKRNPGSPMADEWQLDRARCLLRLGHYDQSAEMLLNPMQANPAADAKRLRLLVHIYERADDEPSMLNALDQLYREYARSGSYADALYFAGDYFSRHGFWQTAAPYYQRLVQSFPNCRWAPQAAWWVAWSTVLEGKADEAAAGVQSYLDRHPHSFHTPAALYWLGRIRQRQGMTLQARAIFRLVESRFPSSYYGMKAAKEVKARFDSPERDADGAPAGRSASVPTPADLKILLAPAPSPIRELPEPESVFEALTPGEVLVELGLSDLATQVLHAAIRRLPPNRELLFAIARLQSEADEPALALFSARDVVPDYQDYSFASLPKEEWELLYPRAYWVVVRAYARAERLSPYLVMALIRQESAFDPLATSPAGARGLMQMRPGTAAGGARGRWRRRRIAQLLYSPRYNIRVSCRYFRDLLIEFQGNLEEAIAAYNAGDVRVKEWLVNGKYPNSDEFVESIPYGDTRVYVESVLRDAAIYRRILNGTARFGRYDLQGN